MGEVVYFNKFRKLQDLREIKDEILEQWSETRAGVLDSETRVWEDDMFDSFVLTAMTTSGLETWEKNYIWDLIDSTDSVVKKY